MSQNIAYILIIQSYLTYSIAGNFNDSYVCITEKLSKKPVRNKRHQNYLKGRRTQIILLKSLFILEVLWDYRFCKVYVLLKKTPKQYNLEMKRRMQK